MRRSGAHVGTLLVLASGCGSGLAPSGSDPNVVPLAGWAAEQAILVCRKIADCCDVTEKKRYSYVNDQQCREMQISLRTNVANLVSQGRAVYDEHAARRCITELTATTCADFFAHDANPGVLGPSCADVAHGALVLGAPCDLDEFCASGNCRLETKTCGPSRACPMSCAAGQYCDEAAGGCVPVKADGADCSGDGECMPPSICRHSVCGAPLAIPNGMECVFDADCASGACLGSSPMTCAPRAADGVQCQTDSACASGACAVRVAIGPQTCGPPLCDGV